MSKSIAFVSVFSAAIGSTAGAWAADESQAPQVEAVTVTTQGRAQSSVDVPIALTALSGQRLEQLDVRDLSTLSAFTPGLLVQDKSAMDSRFIMRGIGSDDGSSYQEPRVSVFIDGTPASKSRGAFVELFDLERVEVARGPQTTLFGQGALIGAINLVQQKPQFGAFDWKAGAELGTFDYRRLDVALNAPFGETLAIRASGQYRNRDGNVRNILGGDDLNGFEVAAGRLSVAWKPTETFRADLIVNEQRDEGTGQSYKSGVFFPANPVTGQIAGGLTPYGVTAQSAGAGFEGGQGLGMVRSTRSAEAILQWEPAASFSVSSTTGWRRFSGEQILDYDGFAFPLLTVGDDVTGESFSQDLRARFAPTSTFDVVAGVSFNREQGRQRTPLLIDERLVLSLYGGGLDLRNPTLEPMAAYVAPQAQAALLQALASKAGGNLSTATALGIAGNLQTAHAEEYSDYAQNKAYDGYVDLGWSATERLHFNLGARYAYSERNSGLSSQVSQRSILGAFIGALGLAAPVRDGLLNVISQPGAATAPGLPIIGIRVQPSQGLETASLTDDGPAFRLAADYKLNDRAAVYATYARGRRPQVLAPIVPSKPLASVVFDKVAAETVDSYEAGLKLRAPDQGLTLNTAFYTYRYEHFQTVIQQGTQFITADAGRADAYGLETDGAWMFAPGAELFANYTYSHARFKQGLYEGNHLALSPDHAVTLGLDVERAAFGGTAHGLAVWRYQSKVWFTDDNAKPALVTGAFVKPIGFEGAQDGYGIADLRLDWSPERANWSAGLFAKNLFDERYVKEAGNGGEDFGLPTYIAGDPRVVGVSFSVRR